MSPRGGTVKAAAQALEDVRVRVGETRAAIEAEETALARTRAQCDEAIEDQALHRKLDAAAGDHRAELGRLAKILGRHEALETEAEQELARACYRTAASQANGAGARVEKAASQVAVLVAELAAACDELGEARARSRDANARAQKLAVADEPSALLEFEEAEPDRLRDLIDFLAAEHDQQVLRHQRRHGREQSERRAVALAAAEKRAERIVANAYAAAPAGQAPRGVWNELLAREGIDVREAVQRLVHERERERALVAA